MSLEAEFKCGDKGRILEGELVGRCGSETTGGYCVIKELSKILRSMDDDGFGSQCSFCRIAVMWLVKGFWL